MRGWSFFSILVIVSGLPSLARAWESECRPEDVAASQFGGHAGSPDRSICAGGEPVCEYGLEWTRGALLGEHAWITRRALVKAGLADFADQPVLSYYSNGATVNDAQGATVPTQIPSREGRSNEPVSRKTTLAEMAQLADGSHSLADFVLGNETCFVPNMPGGTPENKKACHSFNPHMGAVNSTHFLPQAKVVYKQYHDLALQTAAVCKTMKDTVDQANPGALDGQARAAIEKCEMEALALESVASHFLADAWSTGHMWERWGVPLASPVPYLRLAQSAVAVISGMIHGWRSVVRVEASMLEAIGLQVQHDQMCMAGPFDPDGDELESGVVQFVMPGSGALVPGGGDLYLLPCLAYEQNRDWAVAAGTALTPQKSRMVTCVARGFEEVYEAGPKTIGELSLAAGDHDSALDGKTALDPLCWNARVTNQSFRLGMELSDKASLADPALVSRFILKLVLANQAEGLESVGVTDQELQRVRRHARADLVRLASRVQFKAKAEPEGTQLAALDRLETFLGNKRNSAFVQGQSFVRFVPYYERSRNLWDHRPTTDACSTDADCASRPGYYCDTTIAEEKRCMPNSAPILRAFRQGELSYWCRNQRLDEIDAARAHCQTVGSADACAACAEIVLPHVRNACDQSGFDDDSPGGRDVRSLCDVAAGEDRAPLYRVYDAADPGALEAAALDVCHTDPSAPVPSDGFWEPEVRPISVALDPSNATLDVVVSSATTGFELEWQSSTSEPSLSISPASWMLEGGLPRDVSVGATDFGRSYFTDVEFFNQCNPDLRASVRVQVGSSFTYISFDDAPGGAIVGDEYQAQGVVFTGGSTLYGGIGDDAIGVGYICSSSGRGCNSSVTMDFLQPVSSVSFYVGDQERDRRETFTIEVFTGTGVLQTIASNYDRRFYSFSGSDIRQIVFTPSSDWELVDELYFAP